MSSAVQRRAARGDVIGRQPPYGTFKSSLLDQVWAAQPSAHEAILRSIDASGHWPALATYHRPVNAN